MFNINEIVIRAISRNDSYDQLTRVIHKAYKGLSDLGLNYVATTQSVGITKKRIEKAHISLVVTYKNELIGTISLYAPKPSRDCIWYSNTNVSKVGQFAVLPEYQRYGIGNLMMKEVEKIAREIKEVTELALDTAESAYHLINFYEKLGYRHIEKVNWKSTNYSSVVMSRNIK